MSSDNFVDVPAECFVPKPWFFERPSDAIVREIKEHIKATGQPFTWRGNTHLPVDPGVQLLYLGEFDLPEKYQKGEHAPCPICSPQHRKYAFGGKITWSPGEGFIRIIGPECYAKLNKEGHLEAEATFRAEEEARAYRDYLLSNHDRLLKAHATLTDALPTGKALDDFRATLRRQLDNYVRVDLWPHVRDGALSVLERSGEVNFRSGAVREGEQMHAFSRLTGFRMLDPNLKPFARRTQEAIAGLESVDIGDAWNQRIEEMDGDERRDVASIVSKSLDRGKQVLVQMKAVQSFLRPPDTGSLKAWAEHPGCPVSFSVDWEKDGSLRIGMTAFKQTRVPLPAAALGEIGAIEVQSFKESRRAQE